jgi:nucleoside-diphosphate-sugar epimerase
MEVKSMSVTLVTGGLGFVGRYIVQAIAEKGEKVISYNRDFLQSAEPGVTYVQGELYDIPRLLETFRTYGVDRIIHTAAISHPEVSIAMPIATIEANINGTICVYEAAKLAGIKRIVNFSSESVYGNTGEIVREDHPLNPTTPYAVTKVAVELFSKVYKQHYDLDIISLRVTEVFGPGNKMPQVIYDMLRAALDGKTYTLESGGDHRYHFIYVQDVVKAALCALNATENRQQFYNICGGPQASINEAAQIIRELIPGASLNIGPGMTVRDHIGTFDMSASERDLGFVPDWPLQEGIRRYAEWLRTHLY